MNGKVILVGAGPGGRGLLTLRGAEALQSAQVVVYDRLVGADVLQLIPDAAERVDVGKQAGRHPVPQEEINRLLVREARAGKTVVRLKGGDCYLFGRGGEECECLRENGVPFEVVPGITSALAAPAFAGIPVTHRELASSVHIVTAHAKAGGELHIDFQGLARLGGTIVFLMGVSALGFLMEGLLSAGLPPETPAAVVENGARPGQRKLVATAGTLERQAREMGVQSPAVIVVGAVCALSETLDWFSALPLAGRRIVVTRPKARAGSLSGRLRALGAEVIEFPCIETVETPEAPLPDDLSAYSWAVLTSPAGVSAALHALKARGKDLRALYGCRFACIGAGTAKELAKYGIYADFVPEQYDAAHLAAGLCERAAPGDRVLLLRAKEASPDLPDALHRNNIAFTDAAVYRTEYRCERSESLSAQINAGQVDMAAFTSASTVRGFAASAPDADVSRFTAVCIGEATAREAQKHHMKVKTAKNATIDEMIACMLEER